jgi:hypothetical protein
MKLISEYVDQDIEFFTESRDGKKGYFIEGVFAQADTRNRNGRIYPKKIMENAVNNYVENQVKTKRAVGELNHPDGPTINLDKVSHIITDLKWEGNNVVGKASILNTPNGNIVKGLLEGGVKLGVSTRGMGSLERRNDAMYVKDDFMLNTVDIVQDPSAQDAFVNGIMEGVEFVFEHGLLKALSIEEKETEIGEVVAAMKEISPSQQIREFKNFLSNVKHSF